MKKTWCFVIVCLGLGVFLSIIPLVSPKNSGFVLVGLACLIVSQVVTASNCLCAGWPGKPKALDEKKFYRLMGQVQTGQDTTIMVLTDAKERVFCVENPDKPFPEGTEFVRTRKLPDGTWIIDFSIRPPETQSLKPEDSKET